MGQFSVWFSRLSTDASAARGSATESAFDEVDQYFFALRVGSAAAAVVWLWRFAAPGEAANGAALTVAFVLYSLALYLHVWRRPQRRARAYLAVLPADLVFLFLLCLWSAQPMSGVYLGFYLLVALHAFYFGAPVGLAATAGFAVLYSGLYFWLPSPQRCSTEELLLRLLFAFLIAISLALVAHYLQANRERLGDINRQLQQRNRTLEQTYRHLSLGRLAGEVAHHINNPAAVILGKAELLRQRAEREGFSEPYLRDLATIAEHAYRIGRVIRSLVALSPQHDGTPRSLDLTKVTEGVALLFERRAADRQVRIERQLARGLTVRGEESALRQAIVNLLGNALDAVGPGGQVVLETRLGPEPRTAELRVRDNGHGIPGTQIDDIFSPFFTTKNGGEGVGLGLSQSLTIVHRLGGTITAENNPEGGSTFTVAFPLDGNPAGHEEAT